jgi:hypothetical protein
MTTWFWTKPWVDLNSSDENAKKAIINEKEDFRVAYRIVKTYWG